MEQCWEDLAEAIILQAVRDIRAARYLQNREPDNANAMKMIKDVEKFLKSKWFTQLTEINGEYLLGKLREEVTA